MHRFWNQQPVDGKTNEWTTFLEDPEPKLPHEFDWVTLTTATDDEELADFFTRYLRPDTKSTIQLHFSPSFVRWSLTFPGQKNTWIVGVRVKETKKLVATITASPRTLCVHGTTYSVAYVDHLCIHPRLRHKRLAPVLIRAITRRIAESGGLHAIYTGTTRLPGQWCSFQQLGRALRPDVLVESGFWKVPDHAKTTMIRAWDDLPAEVSTDAFGPVRKEDVPSLVRLWNDQTRAYSVAVRVDEDELRHVLFDSNSPVCAHVKRDENGNVTDMWSYQSLTMFVRKDDIAFPIRQARSYYCFATTMRMADLTRDAMIHAKSQGHHIWMTFDVAEVGACQTELNLFPNGMITYFYGFNFQETVSIPPAQLLHWS